MSLSEIKQQLQNLALQRATLKDQLEQIERGMQQLHFGVQVLEAQAKAASEAESIVD